MNTQREDKQCNHAITKKTNYGNYMCKECGFILVELFDKDLTFHYKWVNPYFDEHDF